MAAKASIPTSVLPDDHSEWEPPESMPNSDVKPLSADGSVGSPHVRVGHRQASIRNPSPQGWGFLLSAKKVPENSTKKPGSIRSSEALFELIIEFIFYFLQAYQGEEATVNQVPNEWLLYCRAGFEPDLAAEITSRASDIGEFGQIVAAEPNGGFVRWQSHDDQPVNAIHRELSLMSLVFARQSLIAFEPLSLSREDRITPIVNLVTSSGWNFESIWHETPDTNEGKQLGKLGKSLSRPLESALKRTGALRRKGGGRRLHLFWLAGDQVQIGMSFPGNRSEKPGGVLRLRHPADAPSRSTLKLEEAWHAFIPKDEWETRLSDGMQAVDLGAAPGGWTYQLVRRGMYVYAIDNGPMAASLMKTEQIEHLREDGFVWEPPYRLDWLVCDIVDKPMRVIDMVERWLVKRWCREAIFNLKLPMKKRWEEVKRCLFRLEHTLAEHGVKAAIACRHLYHDREEVTVHVRLSD